MARPALGENRGPRPDCSMAARGRRSQAGLGVVPGSLCRRRWSSRFTAKKIPAGMLRKRKPPERKEGSGCQCPALPLAVRDGETMVMLVTSRETRR